MIEKRQRSRCPRQAGTRGTHGGCTTIAALLVVNDVPASPPPCALRLSCKPHARGSLYFHHGLLAQHPSVCELGNPDVEHKRRLFVFGRLYWYRRQGLRLCKNEPTASCQLSRIKSIGTPPSIILGISFPPLRIWIGSFSYSYSYGGSRHLNNSG
jgi:hypothetical protein